MTSLSAWWCFRVQPHVFLVLDADDFPAPNKGVSWGQRIQSIRTQNRNLDFLDISVKQTQPLTHAGPAHHHFWDIFIWCHDVCPKPWTFHLFFGRTFFLRAFFTSRTPIGSSTLGNLTLQWKIHYVQVYFLFGTYDFHCCVRLLEVRWRLHLISRLLCMATPLLPRTIFLACNRKASIPQLCLKVKQVVDYSRWMMEW